MQLLPLSIIIPTRNRTTVLRRTLESLAAQSAQPPELVVVDASEDESTRHLCNDRSIPGLVSDVRWVRADRAGAACQRNQGVRACSQAVIGFIDDDIVFEPRCIAILWSALQSDARLGGVNATITNQRYQAPGLVSRTMFRLMAGYPESSYAGRVLGPAVNLLPEDREDLPEVVPVQWLNLGCTLYRREALPDPPFPAQFKGYSLMEDVTLSLMVGKWWKLANARTARVYHDSQPGSHKSDPAALAEMLLLNRHYVMTKVLGRTGFVHYAKLAAWLAFSHASTALRGGGWRSEVARLQGEFRAFRAILLSGENAIS